MTGTDDGLEEFRPPTALESAVRALGADTIRYRVDLATDGPIAHLTLHHGKGHESALRFRAYTGEITVDTPMSDTRSDSRP